MTYFLIVYNRSTGKVEVTPYAAADRRGALARRFELEIELRDHPEYEIVVLGGTSLDQIKHTHGRYFKDVSELAAS